jgi:hypothetical protein
LPQVKGVSHVSEFHGAYKYHYAPSMLLPFILMALPIADRRRWHRPPGVERARSRRSAERDQPDALGDEPDMVLLCPKRFTACNGDNIEKIDLAALTVWYAFVRSDVPALRMALASTTCTCI